MSERPIIFSGGMVKRILAGGKAQTRRLVTVGTSATSVPFAELDLSRARVNRGLDGPDTYLSAPRPNDPCGEETEWRVWCRIATGDRLWVKEACYVAPPDFGHPTDANRTDNEGRPRVVGYAATMDGELTRCAEDYGVRKSPSIYMPRWASRLTLEVAGVRVERLQSISEGDAEAEGIDGGPPQRWWYGGPHPVKAKGRKVFTTARGAFADVWDGINGRRAPWESSPWVWAISFSVVPQEPRP